MISNPQERRTRTRRNNLRKKWSGKAWQEKRAGFIKSRGGICEWCGSKDHLTVHHPQRNSYGDTVYMDFYLSGCILLCRKCHAALHAGRTLCEYPHEDGENHYRWHDADKCSYCFLKEHPEIANKKKFEKKLKAAANRHPCKFRHLSGRCQLSPIDSRCQYSAAKAMSGCSEAEAKGVRA